MTLAIVGFILIVLYFGTHYAPLAVLGCACSVTSIINSVITIVCLKRRNK